MLACRRPTKASYGYIIQCAGGRRHALRTPTSQLTLYCPVSPLWYSGGRYRWCAPSYRRPRSMNLLVIIGAQVICLHELSSTFAIMPRQQCRRRYHISRERKRSQDALRAATFLPSYRHRCAPPQHYHLSPACLCHAYIPPVSGQNGGQLWGNQMVQSNL